jgi:hypothetical protein
MTPTKRKPGAGRKKGPEKVELRARVTKPAYKRFKELGGRVWLEDVLSQVRDI